MPRRLSLRRQRSGSGLRLFRRPAFLSVSIFTKIEGWSAQHLNFYRIHLTFFTVTPFILSGIFYAANGQIKHEWVDCLFMVTSALCVVGLNTVVLSELTAFQQAMLFFCMTIGSTSFVSILIILVRRHFFRLKLEHEVSHSAEARHRMNAIAAEEAGKPAFSLNPFRRAPVQRPTDPAAESPSTFEPSTAFSTPEGTRTPREGDGEKKKKSKKKGEKLRADMVRRVDVPVRVNEMNVGGWLREEKEKSKEQGKEAVVAAQASGLIHAGQLTAEPVDDCAIDDTEDDEDTTIASSASKGKEQEAGKASIQIDESSKPNRHQRTRGRSDPWTSGQHHGGGLGLPHTKTMDHRILPQSPNSLYFPRLPTTDRRDESDELRLRRTPARIGDPDFPGRRMSHSTMHSGNRDLYSRTFTRTETYKPEAMNTGFGGFPNPLVAAAGFARRRLTGVVPLEQSRTFQRSTTLASTKTGIPMNRADQRTKAVSYITFDASVGRNSRFRGLTGAQQEELGGVEYRALTVLLRVVISYWALSQLIGVLAIAPWLTHSATYASVFNDPVMGINATWFSFFQVVSAYTNLGMSLIDTSMVPFQEAYWLIIVMSLLILGGNTAFPIFLRLLIWLLSKIVPKQSRTKETLQFLLDHPRRCFIYLFPSHQTWFLLFLLVVLNCIDWVAFLVLDIGTPEIEAIPVGTRILAGLFQSFAVRAAGFAIVGLANLAPAVQLLYCVMMYVAIYPIAVSIRSTNVYEEKSMGVFDDNESEDEDDVEARFNKPSASPTQYIAYHARKQLAFDMWWLVLAVWIICIIERGNITDEQSPWITIFSILFEISSAYGTVGLSLGTQTKNTSLAGALRPMSRLVLIAVMIRGRHRGLPIAIDRAVLLPSDLVKVGDDSAMSFVDEDDASVSSRARSSRRTEGLSTVEPQTDQQRVDTQTLAAGWTLPKEVERADGSVGSSKES